MGFIELPLVCGAPITYCLTAKAFTDTQKLFTQFSAVIDLIWLVNKGHLLSMCSDDCIYLWDVKQREVELMQHIRFNRERLTTMYLGERELIKDYVNSNDKLCFQLWIPIGSLLELREGTPTSWSWTPSPSQGTSSTGTKPSESRHPHTLALSHTYLVSSFIFSKKLKTDLGGKHSKFCESSANQVSQHHD